MADSRRDAGVVHPWLNSAYQDLASRAGQGWFPHAVMLTGPRGIGKSDFTNALANRLLCATPSGADACGQCRPCQLSASGSHPDLIRVQPEAAERPVIKVDQVRALAEELGLASHAGYGRVAVLDPADRLNAQAANSLLKTLEEPPPGVVLLLVATTPGRLPATIRSRCQTVALPVPARDQAQQWLRAHNRWDAVELLGMAEGAPLRALTLADANQGTMGRELAGDLAAALQGERQATALAARWQATGAAVVNARARQYLADVIRAKAAGIEATRDAATEPLVRLLAPTDWRVLYECSDELSALDRALEQPLNETLALERLFLTWQRMRVSGADRTG